MRGVAFLAARGRPSDPSPGCPQDPPSNRKHWGVALMRGCPGAGFIPVMANINHVDVKITIDRDARPIQGWIGIDGRPDGRFHGWFELNDRLEQALSTAAVAELRKQLNSMRADLHCQLDIEPAGRRQL